MRCVKNVMTMDSRNFLNSGCSNSVGQFFATINDPQAEESLFYLDEQTRETKELSQETALVSVSAVLPIRNA
jgi:hypothetical protein